MAEQAKFLDGSLLRHITVMSLTATIGLVAVFLVDFIDMVFISMLGRDELAAAVGYSGAILFFTTSFGIGIAIAAGALVARALGKGETGLARQRATNTLITGTIVGTVFAALVWYNLETLARLVGASGVTLDLSVQYLSIIVPSLPLLLLGISGSALLRAYGDARGSMMTAVYGGVVNAALDPVLIFALGLELKGAAIASVLARIVMAITALWPVIRKYQGLCPPRMASLMRDQSPILTLAFPAILTQLATPVGQAYMTRAMAVYGEDAVSGMSIVARLTPVAFAVLFAMSGAIGPIIGQNAGAGNVARVRLAYRESLTFTGIVTVIVAIGLYVLRTPIAALFNADGLVRELVFLFCGPLALASFFNGVIFASNAGFNNLGRPFYSTWVNWGRHTLGTIPFIMVFAAWLGAPGVLIGQAAGGAVFAALAIWLSWRVIDGLEGGEPVEHPHFIRHVRQMQLWHLHR